MNRRELLSRATHGMALMLTSSLPIDKVFAYPLSRILGANDHAYVSEYLRRMMNWYSREFGAPLSSLTDVEHGYVDSCIAELDRFSLDLPGDNAFEYFTLSHRVYRERIAHGLVFAGTPNLKTTEMRSKIDAIARRRGVKIEFENLFGLGWNVEEKTFDIVHLHSGSEFLEPALRVQAEKHSTTSTLPERLVTVTHRNGKVVARKVTLAFEEPPKSIPEGLPFAPAIVAAMKTVSDDGQVDWLYRLKAFHLSMVAPHARGPALAHTREFAQLANKIVWHSANDCILQYP